MRVQKRFTATSAELAATDEELFSSVPPDTTTPQRRARCVACDLLTPLAPDEVAICLSCRADPHICLQSLITYAEQAQARMQAAWEGANIVELAMQAHPELLARFVAFTAAYDDASEQARRKVQRTITAANEASDTLPPMLREAIKLYHRYRTEAQAVAMWQAKREQVARLFAGLQH